MKYHKYRFGLIRNFKVFLCKTFGHRLNEDPSHHWCGRCGLCYEECYFPDDYYIESGIVKVPENETGDYLAEKARNILRDKKN